MNNLKYSLNGKMHRTGFCCGLVWRVVLSIALIWPGYHLIGQNEEPNDSTERVTPRLRFTATQLNGDSILLQVTIQVRREGVIQLVDYEPVEFFYVNDTLLRTLGTSLTNDKGLARLWISDTALLSNNPGVCTFKVIFHGREDIDEGEAEVSIKKAEIKIIVEETDSIHSLTLKLFASGEETTPLASTDVVLYVKRYFSNLKLGEGTTDENGEISFEVPRDLPGDESGHIILIGQAEDLEEYGTVSATMAKPWGVPLNPENDKITRALWSHAPPIWMLIVFVVLMSVVWGHYFVIIYKFIKLRKQ